LSSTPVVASAVLLGIVPNNYLASDAAVVAYIQARQKRYFCFRFNELKQSRNVIDRARSFVLRFSHVNPSQVADRPRVGINKPGFEGASSHASHSS
jgi:hypothetical protein